MKLTLPWAKKPKNNFLVLLAFVASAQSAGLLGTLFTFSAIPTWYAALNKPFFAPPNFLFGPVWTLLYTLMGVAAYLVWRQYQFRRPAQAFWEMYLTQLLLNALWTPLFFGAKWLGVALVEILALWYFIARTIQEGYPLNRWVAWLLSPYLAWVSFATLLNGALFLLNR